MATTVYVAPYVKGPVPALRPAEAAGSRGWRSWFKALGVYVSMALAWLWLVDGVAPHPLDYIGVAMCLAGMAVIMLANGS